MSLKRTGRKTSPLYKNGDPMKKMPTEKAITGKIPKSGTPEFKDMEEGAGTQDELNRMGKYRRQDIDRSDGWSQPSQTKLLQHEINRNSGFADFKATNTMEKRYSGRKVSPLRANGGPGDKKKSSVAGQDIHESGHMNESYQDGPSEGDLVRGKHLSYDKDGYVEDLDYKVKFEKDTSDVNGPYKIWKTTGIKGGGAGGSW